jgi:diguanylate cyclase (GGDEF)-like protein
MNEVEGPLLRVTVLVANSANTMSGYLVADIGLQVLQPLLETTTGKRLYLASNETRLLNSSGAASLSTPITTSAQKRTFGPESVMHYRDYRGLTMLGLVAPTRVDGLRVLAEMDAEDAFAELTQLKTRVLCIFVAVLGVLMVAAHLFGASLVLPLKALVDGARRVADGNLDIELPAARHDEIGYLSRVFNDMVERLKDSRRTVETAQSKLLEQNRRLEELTVTDNLTGLANRRSLVENLTLQLERYRRNGQPFSVLMLDLDNFKSVNDRYGHLAGDEVLRRFSTSMVGSIRSVDFAARYGGEEFSIILFDTESSDASDLAERIRAQVDQMRVELEPGLVLTVTASIGVAEVCDTDAKPDDLLQRADAALYRAKQAGRNRVYLASDAGRSIGRN